jgi:hypothetical protein
VPGQTEKNCAREFCVQVAQLQKLISEKDAQINDVKAKSRDLQVTLQNVHHGQSGPFHEGPLCGSVARALMRNVSQGI